MSFNDITRPFISIYAFSDQTIDLVTDGVSSEDAFYRMRDGEGPSILWTLGYLYEYRGRVLESMEINVDKKYREIFCDQPASEGAGYPGLEELIEMWGARAVELRTALADLPREAFLAEDGDPTSFFTGLTFNIFHEASHMGVLNTIRKELGYPSASEIVIARMRGD